jgi:hypothetical protein
LKHDAFAGQSQIAWNFGNVEIQLTFSNLSCRARVTCSIPTQAQTEEKHVTGVKPWTLGPTILPFWPFSLDLPFRAVLRVESRLGALSGEVQF